MIGPLTLLLAAATAAASPAPSAAPSDKASAAPQERVAIVTCDRGAYFWIWPDYSGSPYYSPYPPARPNDAIHVIGHEVLTPGGYNLTETTIDVVSPWGSTGFTGRSKHYWIATNCIV